MRVDLIGQSIILHELGGKNAATLGGWYQRTSPAICKGEKVSAVYVYYVMLRKKNFL